VLSSNGIMENETIGLVSKVGPISGRGAGIDRYRYYGQYSESDRLEQMDKWVYNVRVRVFQI
jgi:hypothetical protein